MKTTVAKLSDISNMKFDIEDELLIDKLSELENKVRIKYNIKESAKLKDIEAYFDQCNFIFSNHEVVFLCE